MKITNKESNIHNVFPTQFESKAPESQLLPLWVSAELDTRDSIFMAAYCTKNKEVNPHTRLRREL